MDQEVVCKTCDRGTMVRMKIRRMSGIVVFIGFLILIPSFLGLGIGAIGLAGSGLIASEAGKTPEQVEKDLETASVPPPLIAQVMEGKPVTREELSSLNESQLMAVQKGQIAIVSKDLPAGALVGGAAIILVSSLVGGLLGWLLIMKKWVLRCTNCSAVVAAS